MFKWKDPTYGVIIVCETKPSSDSCGELVETALQLKFFET